MATPPSDNPAPERPLPWWQNRRRLFYLAVVGATLAALWGGWVWWYRAGFPFPRLHRFQGLGIDLTRPGSWCYEKEEALRIWKIRRETRRLKLEGTVWEAQPSGVTLSFQSDGRLALDGPPGWLNRVFAGDPFGPDPDLTPKERAALAALNGAPHRHLKDVPWGERWWPAQPNLELAGTPWKGFLSFDARVLQMEVRPQDLASDLRPIRLHLARPDP